ELARRHERHHREAPPLPVAAVNPRALLRPAPADPNDTATDDDGFWTRRDLADAVDLGLPGPSSWPRLAPFEGLGEIGRGGMGVVYKAKQLTTGRVVALKMILAGLQTSADDLARFRGEIETIARLQHPHIVPVYDVGDYHGRPYFAMEFAETGTLADRVNGQPQPFRASAQLVEALARAVHFTHERGIIHRDLNPANRALLIRQAFGPPPRAAAPAP